MEASAVKSLAPRCAVLGCRVQGVGLIGRGLRVWGLGSLRVEGRLFVGLGFVGFCSIG